MGNDRAWAVGLVVALAALPALAGCLGTAQASAMEHEDGAAEIARAWDQGAQLVQIVGAEGTNWMSSFGAMGWSGFGGWDWNGRGGHPSAQAASAPGAYSTQASHAGPDYWDRAADDDRIGDGKCEVWAYRYVAANKPGQAYVVVLDRDGELLHRGVDEADGDDVPLGRWHVDSDEAAEIARDNNDGLRAGTDAEHFGIVLVLGHEEGEPNPVWLVAGGGGDASGGGGGFATIDALTGEVIASEGGFGGTR